MALTAGSYVQVVRRIAILALVFAAAAPQAAGAATRIVYASDWNGPMEIFAADPSGRAPTKQLTFSSPHGRCSWAAACGYWRPLPSPDGDAIVYWSSGGAPYETQTLWVARTDGSGAHAVGEATSADWAPDSRRLVYSAADGIHVLSPAGDRIVDRRQVGTVRYSPDGRAIAFVGTRGLTLLEGGHERVLRTVGGRLLAFAWSGTAIAYATNLGVYVDGRRVYRLSASDSSPVLPYPFELAATRDGAHVAFTVANAIRIVDTRSLRVHTVRGVGHDLAWSPDGRTLLYDQFDEDTDGSSLATGDVLTASLSGHVRVAVAASKPYGGQIVSAAWMNVAPYVLYRPPQRVDGVFAGGPVQELVADGGRVAFDACANVSAWTPATGEVVPVETQRCQAPISREHVYSLALAGDEVAWWEKGYGLCYVFRAQEVTLGSTPFQFGQGSGCLGGAPLQGTGSAVGSGSLLVFGDWSAHFGPTEIVDTESIDRLGATGCPCSALSSTPGPYTPLDVDAGRIVVSGTEETRVLDADGRVLLNLPVPTLAAQLTGNELVLAVDGRLRVYDVTSGVLRASWPLPDAAAGHHCDLYGEPTCQQSALTLDDASHGLAVYVVDGEVRVVRLSDGVDRLVALGTVARFMDDGLVYADGARVRLLPYDELLR